MNVLKYWGENLKQIKFLLGGVGAGNVSLEGRGSLTDWEIFNRPSKGNEMYGNFVALRVEQRRKLSFSTFVNFRNFWRTTIKPRGIFSLIFLGKNSHFSLIETRIPHYSARFAVRTRHQSRINYPNVILTIDIKLKRNKKG